MPTSTSFMVVTKPPNSDPPHCSFLNLSNLEGCHKLRYCSGMEWIFSHTLLRLNAKVREALAIADIDVSGISSSLNEVFQDIPSPFEGLETR